MRVLIAAGIAQILRERRSGDGVREAVNYSEVDRPHEEALEAIKVLLDGSMPPPICARCGLHPDANLSSARVYAVEMCGSRSDRVGSQ